MPKIEIYTTAICPYCENAKKFFKQKGWDYQEIHVDTDAAAREAMLARSSGRRSVPQIFIGGVHVGGFDDLVAADRAGRLGELMGTAP